MLASVLSMGSRCGAMRRTESLAVFMPIDVESRRSREIDRDIDSEKKQAVLKILLLGPGESGKSTTLKQLKIIHAEGYSRDDLLQRRHVIYANLIDGLCAIMNELSRADAQLSPAREHDADVIARFSDRLRLEDVAPLPSDVVDSATNLFVLPVVQNVLQGTEDHVIDDAAKFFLWNLARIGDAEYVPTLQDVLRSRVPTQGVTAMRFHIKNFHFNVIDVGGQRTQRRKWFHVFDNVHAVLFITSLAEYTQTVPENPAVNRMRESLGLFGSICKNEMFVNTAIVLFLNKTDLFAERIRRHPIKDFFSRYNGPNTYEEGLAYITRRFNRQNTNTSRIVYVHHTCVTDTKSIQIVFDSVINVVIQQAMQTIGIE